jgi:hypothetical protein
MFWRLSFLVAIVVSCFLGHLRFLGLFCDGRRRFAQVDLMRGAREDKELLLGALQRIDTIRTVSETIDSKTRIVLHFAGESDSEPT